MSGVFLNSTLASFNKFSQEAYDTAGGPQGKTIACINSKTGKVEISSAKGVKSGEADSVNRLSRDTNHKAINNETRRCFYNAIVEQFGGKAENIPECVQKHLKLKDYGKLKNNELAGGVIGKGSNLFSSGQPLDAERVRKVITAISEYEMAHPEKFGARLAQELKVIMLNGKDVDTKMGDFLSLFYQKMFKDCLTRNPNEKEHEKKIRDICTALAKPETFESGKKQLMKDLTQTIRALGSVNEEEKITWYKNVLKEFQNDFAGQSIPGNAKAVVPDDLQKTGGDMQWTAPEEYETLLTKSGKNAFVLLQKGAKVENPQARTKEIRTQLSAFVSGMFGTDALKNRGRDLQKIALVLSKTMASENTGDNKVKCQDALEKLYELIDDCKKTATPQQQSECQKKLLGFIDEQRKRESSWQADDWGKVLAGKYGRIAARVDNAGGMERFFKGVFKDMFKGAMSAARTVSSDEHVILSNFKKLPALVGNLAVAESKAEGPKKVKARNEALEALQKCFGNCLQAMKAQERKGTGLVPPEENSEKIDSEWVEGAMTRFFDDVKTAANPGAAKPAGDKAKKEAKVAENGGQPVPLRDELKKRMEQKPLTENLEDGEEEISTKTTKRTGKLIEVENEVTGTDFDKVDKAFAKKPDAVEAFIGKLKEVCKANQAEEPVVNESSRLLQEKLDEVYRKEIRTPGDMTRVFGEEQGGNKFKTVLTKTWENELKQENSELKTAAAEDLKILPSEEFWKNCAPEFREQLEGRTEDMCTEDGFLPMNGWAQDVTEELVNRDPSALCFMQINADTKNGGGFWGSANSMEEMAVRANPNALLALAENGMVEFDEKKTTTPYTKKGESLNAAKGGYMMTAQQMYAVSKTSGKTLKKPVNLVYQFFSLPSLKGGSGYEDIPGDVTYMLKCLDDNKGKLDPELRRKLDDPKERKNLEAKATDFFTQFSTKAEKELKVTGLAKDPKRDEFHRKAFTLCIFGIAQGNMPVNVFGENTAKEVDKAIKLVKSTKEEDMDRLEGLLKQAEKDYDWGIRQMIRKKIIESKAMGCKYYIGSNIGSGAFNHDPEKTARIIAEEFYCYGKGMQYVLPMGPEGTDANALILQRVMKEVREELGIPERQAS